MTDIKFEKIDGEGEDALYNLFFDGKLVKAALTMSEVLIEINKGYEEEKK